MLVCLEKDGGVTLVYHPGDEAALLIWEKENGYVEFI